MTRDGRELATAGEPRARGSVVACPSGRTRRVLPALFALVMVVAFAPAAAQEKVRLRAGEHSGFSRIAIDIPRLAGWQVEKAGRLITLVVPNRELLFDTDQIFPERRVSRVTSARSERGRQGTRLVLSMSCECDAQTYEFRPGMLVIDIRATPPDQQAARAGEAQGDAPQGGPDGEAAPGDAAGGDGSGVAEAPRLAPGSMDALAVHRGAPPPATSASVLGADPQPATPGQSAEATPSRPAATVPAPQAAPDAVSISEAQRKLLEQLARAADQGLVQFRDPGGPDDPRKARDEGAPGAEPPGSPAATPGAAPDPHAAEAPHAPGAEAGRRPADPLVAAPRDPTRAEGARPSEPPPTVQLEARTVWDRDRRPAPPRAATCPDDALLDPAPWRTEADAYDRIGQLRGRLMQEFDKPDAKLALQLAWLQVGYGFGAEARQTLDQFVPAVREAALLRDLAHMVDDEPPGPDGPLAQGATCPGRAGMWRLAAGLDPDPGSLSDKAWRDSVLDAFAELPVRLRRFAGPPLVNALVRLGQLDFAEAARLRLDRAPGDHSPAWKLALGRLALARGEVARGEALLMEVAATGGPEAAEAMLDLADSVLGRSDALPAALVEDIALAAFEHQGTELGRRLLVAEILGRAGRDQLGPALAVIETELFAGGARAADLEAALRAILERATADAVGHGEYAQAIMRHRGLLRDPELFDPARIHVAREMTAIGLANVALDLLGPALGRNGQEARLAAAEAEVTLGQPTDALTRLDGLPGDDAARLAARALMALGRDGEAYVRIAGILPAEAPERAELAWRAAVWKDAARLPGADPRRLLAAWMAGEPPPDPTAVVARALALNGEAPVMPPPGPATAAQASQAQDGPPPDDAALSAAREALFLTPPKVAEPPSLAAARRLIQRSQQARDRIEQALKGV